MNFLKRQIYEIALGFSVILFLGLLILHFVLAMISVTSGVSQGIGASTMGGKAETFHLDAAAALNLE